MTKNNGCMGRILTVDLTLGALGTVPTADYAAKFIGGMGTASKIYWDEINPGTKALDPENILIFMTGPAAGFTKIAGSIWQIHCKSPLTIPEQFTYGALGGSFGANLKFAGYDGIIIRGRSERPVLLHIADGKAELKNARSFWGKGAIETREALKKVFGRKARVAAIGPAGEKAVLFANVIADEDASAAAGVGAVMGSKNLKAVIVHGNEKPAAANPEKLREIAKTARFLKEGAAISDFGFVPGPDMKRQDCYGCINGCIRSVMRSADGKQGKYMCQSGIFYQYRAKRYYNEWNEVPFYANKLCDDFGIDTRVTESMLAWLIRCFRAGVLTEADTGLPFSKFGSLEFIDNLVRKISARDGFGDILAGGVVKAADAFGEKGRALLTDYSFHTTGQASEGDPRRDIVTGLIYAMQPRQHAVSSEIATIIGKWALWAKGKEGAYMTPEMLQAISKRLFGNVEAVDYSTPVGKGVAAKVMQDRWSARESLILCAFSWPIIDAVKTADHMGDPSLESKLFCAVTGMKSDESELNKIGERIFNLRRAIFFREGSKGRETEAIPEVFYKRPLRDRLDPEASCIMPGPDGKPLAMKGSVVDRKTLERIKDDYYRARGWDVASGFLKRDTLNRLGLSDVAAKLAQAGGVKP